MRDVKQTVAVKLEQSEIFRDYQEAFTATTGLPLQLRETVATPPGGDDQIQSTKASPFCSLMATVNSTCRGCLESRERLADKAEGATEPVQVTCFAGLVETAVPVVVGRQTVGFLRTGGVATEVLTSEHFSRTARSLLKFGTQVDLRRVEEAYFQSRVLEGDRYEAMVRLLWIFSQHLSGVAEQIALTTHDKEPEVVRNARRFMEDNAAESISLADVAQAVNVSSYYFCRVFKKATGLSFTQYLSRLRVERAKNLLLNPNRRITEVAYDVGFESITHFNRVFRQIAGQSPSQFRKVSAREQLVA